MRYPSAGPAANRRETDRFLRLAWGGFSPRRLLPSTSPILGKQTGGGKIGKADFRYSIMLWCTPDLGPSGELERPIKTRTDAENKKSTPSVGKSRKNVTGGEPEDRDVFERSGIAVAVFSPDGSYKKFNPHFETLLKQLKSTKTDDRPWLTFIPTSWRERARSNWKKISSKAVFRDHEVKIKNDHGGTLILTASGGMLEKKEDGNNLLFVTVQGLAAAGRRLGRGGRTVEASASRLKTLELELEQANSEVVRQRENVKKVNEAMKVLVVEIQKQKEDLEQRITTNFRLTILPLLEHLSSMEMPESQRTLLDSLEFGLRHITSYFGVRLSSATDSLSRREMQVCSLIAQGKATREIAHSLGLSAATVVVHRKNIRRKLGIKSLKRNLASTIKQTF